MDDQTLLRYSRQIMLPEIDFEGQQRLRSAHVAVVGAGGLGSPITLYLAAAGIGRLTLIDHDVVELSNLQRQIAHRTADIGRSKVQSAADAAKALNPGVEVVCIYSAFDTHDRWHDLIASVDVVADASDNLATRMAVNAACVAAQRPLVSGAAIRFEGQVLVYRPDYPDSPCYRCLYRSDTDVAETCAQNGVIAPLLGVIGSVQALEVIKIVCHIGETLTGRLLLFDALHMEWQTLKLARNRDCPVCAK